MSAIFDSNFSGTAGDLIETSAPTIGSPIVHLSGTDTCLIDTTGQGVVGTDDSTSDEFGFVGTFDGVLTDIAFQVQCLSAGYSSINVQACAYSGFSIVAGLSYNGGTGNQLWFLNYTSPTFPSGAVQRSEFVIDVGRTYTCRLLVTPYICRLFIDGTLLLICPGTDDLGFTAANVGQPTFYFSGNTYKVARLRAKVANPRPTTRSIPAALESALQNEALGLAMCFNVLLVDGTIFGFTTHDVDIVLGPTTYYAMSSVTSTNIRFEVGGNAGNFDMDGLLSSDLITEADLLAGRFDSAELTIFLVDWTDVSNGVATLLRGNIGDITVVDGKYTASVRSLMQWYQQQQVEVTSPTCRVYHFMDARCKFNSANDLQGDAVQSTGTIATVVDPYTLTFTGGVAKAGFYNAGTLQGLTGLNTNYVREVKLHSNNDMLDSVVVGAPGLPYSNIGFKPALDFTPSVSPIFTIPAGIWEQIQILVNNTWHLRHAITPGTDQLCIQLPWGQANDTVLRTSSTPISTGIPANFNDRQILGDIANYAVNVASYGGGGPFKIGLRHTSSAQEPQSAGSFLGFISGGGGTGESGGGPPFFNITITDLNLQLLGVAAAVSSRLILHEPFPYPVSPGDTFLMIAGCDRSVAMCSLRFNNIVNFRGEPQIPGVDALMQQGRPPS